MKGGKKMKQNLPYKVINNKQALDLIYGYKGTIFTTVFWKRTTSDKYVKEIKKETPDPEKVAEYKQIWRVMTCRLGVKKGVKGVGMSYDPKQYRLVPVYYVQLALNKKQNPEKLEEHELKGLPFRNIPIDNVVWMSIGGKDYLVK